MKGIWIFLLVFLGLTGCGEHSRLRQSIKSPGEAMLADKIDTLVRQYLDLDIFSGVVLVAERGFPIYHKAFGLADREQNIPNTTSTLFDIGSMNKTFTSIVVRQLIAEGKLRYEDKLTDHISGFADPAIKQVTVQQLLQHESGFGDYHSPDYFDAPPEQKKLVAIIERLKGETLAFEPGTDRAYSNSGYILLGGIIEAVTGKSYFDNVRARIISPLKLKDTYVEISPDLTDRRAAGYYFTPLGQLVKNDHFVDSPNPDGGFLSTTKEVMRFYRSYYYADLLLNEEAKAEDPYFQFIRSLPAGKAPLAAGGFEGFNTAFYQVISEDISILVFANMDEPIAEQIASGVLSITRGQKPEPALLPAVQRVRIAFQKKGPAYVKTNFEELTKNYHPEDPKDWILNGIGYAFLARERSLDTVSMLFQLNTSLFPEVANTWDSYGEVLLKQGDKAAALTAYKMALTKDPELPSALKMVEKLSN